MTRHPTKTTNNLWISYINLRMVILGLTSVRLFLDFHAPTINTTTTIDPKVGSEDMCYWLTICLLVMVSRCKFDETLSFSIRIVILGGGLIDYQILICDFDLKLIFDFGFWFEFEIARWILIFPFCDLIWTIVLHRH